MLPRYGDDGCLLIAQRPTVLKAPALKKLSSRAAIFSEGDGIGSLL
jgi:hypothetical protein